MARLTDAIMKNTAYSKGMLNPMLDLANGGQFGYAPKLTEWVSNQAYVRRNLICILLEAPRFFQSMPEPQIWVESLKSLVELHCRTIEGFNAGITVETDNHPVGGAGELQDEYVDVKRARTEPSFTFVEKYGLPIQTFIYNWITYGMMDPDTKYALISTLNNEGPDDLLADWYSMTCAFIEPDPTHKKVVKSYVTTNMFPKGTGEIMSKRDLTAGSEILTLTIDFTGITQVGIGTNTFCQRLLDEINLTNANPYLRPSFIQKLDSNIDANTNGYENGITELGTTAVPGMNG
jgi:hypothetical protein